MSARARKTGLVGFGAMAAVLAFASVAWACTAQVGLKPLADISGRPGSKVAVTGTSDRSGAVELRWNGVKGPLLGTAVADQGDHGTTFTTEVTIPEVSPGVYYMVLVPGDAAVGVGRAAFEVLPSTSDGARSVDASASGASGQLWSAFGDAGQAPAPVQSSPAFMTGMLLLGVGMVAMVGGFGVAAVRRRSRFGVARSDTDFTE